MAVALEGTRDQAGFVRGLTALPRGARYLLVHPRLWVFALLPLAINMLLFLALFGVALEYVLPALVDWLTPETLPTWLSWLEGWLRPVLRWLIYLSAGLLFMLVAAISFTTVGCVLAAPFNDLLSEKVERLLLGRTLGPGFSLRVLMEDAARTIVQAAWKLAIVVLVFVGTLPLLLVPVLGQVFVPALNTLVAVWFLAVEFVDLPMARARWTLGTRRAWCAGRRTALLGFGSGVYLVCLIPFMALLIMPAAVTGGTLLFLETTPAEELVEHEGESAEEAAPSEEEGAPPEPGAPSS